MNNQHQSRVSCSSLPRSNKQIYRFIEQPLDGGFLFRGKHAQSSGTGGIEVANDVLTLAATSAEQRLYPHNFDAHWHCLAGCPCSLATRRAGGSGLSLSRPFFSANKPTSQSLSYWRVSIAESIVSATGWTTYCRETCGARVTCIQLTAWIAACQLTCM